MFTSRVLGLVDAVTTFLFLAHGIWKGVAENSFEVIKIQGGIVFVMLKIEVHFE